MLQKLNIILSRSVIILICTFNNPYLHLNILPSPHQHILPLFTCRFAGDRFEARIKVACEAHYPFGTSGHAGGRRRDSGFISSPSDYCVQALPHSQVTCRTFQNQWILAGNDHQSLFCHQNLRAYSPSTTVAIPTSAAIMYFDDRPSPLLPQCHLLS